MGRTFQFHVSGRRLLVGLLLTFVPISLLALYASTRIGRGSEETSGQRLEAVARLTASNIQDRVRAKVVQAALIASDSAVRATVEESNRSYGRASDEQIKAQLEALDANWNTQRGQELAEQMLANPASLALRRMLELEPDFLRISVTDRHGASIAASHKTLDYYQADEEFWQDIFVTGRGAVSLTDVLYDDATHHYYIGVGVPVFDDNNVLIGTLDALVDIAALFPLVTSQELGGSGRTALVKTDGLVIAGSGGISLANPVESQDFAALRDAGARFEGAVSGHFQADFPDGRQRLIAFGDAGLEREFRNLGWTVVVSQDAAEALRSSLLSQVLIMLIALLTLASVVFTAVYVTMHEPTEVEEMEEMRHPAEAA